MMRRWSLGVVAVLFSLQTLLAGGDWSAPIVLRELPVLFFRWRVIAKHSNLAYNNIEWEFRNSSDSTLSFSYSILTEQKERQVGRLTMKPHQIRIAGWSFKGAGVAQLELDQIEIVGAPK